MDSSDEAGKETVKDQMERILPANLDTQVLEIDSSATRASAPPSAVPQVQTGTQMGSSDEAGKESVKDQMERILRANLDIQVLEIVDTSGNCGSSYALAIVSKDFAGKMMLARHKLVNQMLKSQIEQLHAFSQKTLTPQQWEAEKKKSS